jgi:hypothetical protein
MLNRERAQHAHAADRLSARKIGTFLHLRPAARLRRLMGRPLGCNQVIAS